MEPSRTFAISYNISIVVCKIQSNMKFQISRIGLHVHILARPLCSSVLIMNGDLGHSFSRAVHKHLDELADVLNTMQIHSEETSDLLKNRPFNKS